MPCTWAYIEMMRGRRGNYRYHKCGWFSHMVYHCRQREILEERRRKLVCEGNKFTPLLSKVCRRMERGYVDTPELKIPLEESLAGVIKGFSPIT